MAKKRPLTSAEVRKRLAHPIIDADGHLLEVGPVLMDYLRHASCPPQHPRQTVAGPVMYASSTFLSELKMSSPHVAADGVRRLSSNPYPGRGIVVGVNSIGTAAIQVYWIMGRSENSRSRVMRREGNAIKVEPLGGTSLAGAELLIYTAMLQVGKRHVVSNGDQTDTIANALAAGRTFGSGMLSRQHEPDAPHYTPRIAGMVEIGLGGEDEPARPIFRLAKITSDPADGTQSVHGFYSFTRLAPGAGMCIHTYAGDGNPLPSFREDPFPVPLSAGVDDIAGTYWETLNVNNRVALVVKAIDIATGAVQSKILNRHKPA